MNDNDKKTTYLTRERILKMLSDDEVAKVGTAESAAHLAKGDEYIDLERIDRGVQTAQGTGPAMGNVLPKQSVQDSTWKRIVGQLTKRSSAGAHFAA